LILPKILIIIPIWQRPEITEICFSGLDRLRSHRSRLEVLAVISEDYYKERCNNHSIDYTFFENQPLGRKKNHGLKIALEHDWDYLIELNSDDVIKNELLDVYDTLTDDYLALRNFCFMDSKTLDVRQIESKTAFGIGRRYSRKAVEACKVTEVNVKKSCISGAGALIEGTKKDIKPYIAKDLEKAGYVEIVGEGVKMWNDQASAGMDNFSNLRLMDNGFKCRQIFTEEPLAVDIKSDINIWSYNKDAGTDYSLSELKNGLPELDGIINSHAVNI
jgi:hypothetical protein